MVWPGKKILQNGTQKLWGNNDLVMYSNFNEGKLVVAEIFIATLKGEI